MHHHFTWNQTSHSKMLSLFVCQPNRWNRILKTTAKLIQTTKYFMEYERYYHAHKSPQVDNIPRLIKTLCTPIFKTRFYKSSFSVSGSSKWFYSIRSSNQAFVWNLHFSQPPLSYPCNRRSFHHLNDVWCWLHCEKHNIQLAYTDFSHASRTAGSKFYAIYFNERYASSIH
jgi:hypothetical protein